jgi:hypothetical protein
MGITAHYYRLPQAESEATTASPAPWAGPRLDIDKAWGGIQFLLRAAGIPVDVISEDMENAWDAGPPCYFTAGEVQTAADFMRRWPFQRLMTHYDADKMTRQGTYPSELWREPGVGSYLEQHYQRLREFFAEAAAVGDAVAAWLS